MGIHRTRVRIRIRVSVQGALGESESILAVLEVTCVMG